MTAKLDIPEKKCIYCGNYFQPYMRKQNVCNNPECKKKRNHDSYAKRTKECVCSKCGNIYYATDKQSKSLCKNCVRSEKYNYNEEYIQNIVCRVCGKIVGTRVKNKTRKPLINSKEVTCEDCKKKWHEKSSLRMKLCNPNSESLTLDEYNKLKEKQEKDREIWYKEKDSRKENNRKKASERMRKNNPMRNKKSVEKMIRTLKENIKSGKTVYKKGKDRKNWKGGHSRNIQNYLRVALKTWRQQKLKESNYTCQICGKRHCYFNVHHTYPFRLIVNDALKDLNLNIDDIKFRSEEYDILEKWIVEYHFNNNVGIVLCQDCHDSVDMYFHKSNLLEWGYNREDKKDRTRRI